MAGVAAGAMLDARRRSDAAFDRDDAMDMATQDSLTLWLRTLTTLTRRVPLDVARLARLNGNRPRKTEAVVAELGRDGLVRRAAVWALIVAADCCAALAGGALTAASLR